MQFDYVFFDLDGTLIDSFEGVTKSVQYALKKLGQPEKTQEQLRCFIGPPLRDQFKTYCNITEERANEAVVFFRERYQDVGWKECTLIDGAREILEQLSSNGIKSVLATSKLEYSARRVLDYYDIAKYFSFVSGSQPDATRTNKNEVIDYALQALDIKDTSRVLMVGDRYHDIVGARACGIKCAAVLCGFGSREEFVEYKADYIIDGLADIADIVFDLNTFPYILQN